MINQSQPKTIGPKEEKTQITLEEEQNKLSLKRHGY